MRRRPPATAPPLAQVLTELHALGRPEVRAGLARFAIPDAAAIGVPVGELRALARRVGQHHELALALWEQPLYEARMLSVFVDEPERVDPAQMDRCIAEVDDWSLCDTLCFHLYDRTPHAWARVHAWAPRSETFVRRGAFALLASLALHRKELSDEPFFEALPLAVEAATDPRNFVKKGVSWALRGVGQRSLALHGAVLEISAALEGSADRTARWVGKDVGKELRSEVVARRLAKRG
jgi:3-methyladenine DNA glycosylase AlkD